jgi:hypothetical protein
MLYSDGVPMQSEAYAAYEFEGRRSLPGQRVAELNAYGQEGVTFTFGGSQPKTYRLRMWVDGLNPDGSEPHSLRVQYERNMSTVAGFFAKRGLWQLSQRMPDGTMRYANVRTLSFEEAEEHPGSGAPLSRVAVVLENPSGWWTDRTVPAVHHSTVFNEYVPVTALMGDVAKGVVTDAVLTVWGPASNIRFECGESWITHEGPLLGDESLVIDCGRRKAVKIAGTAPGVSALRQIAWGGGVGMFDMLPPHHVKVTATGGSAWRIAGFPKYN